MSLNRIYIDHTLIKYFIESVIREIPRETADVNEEISYNFLQDADEFLMNNRREIERLTTNLMMKKISSSEYTRRIESKCKMIEMNALKQYGLEKMKVDQLRQNIIKIIISSAFELCGGRFIRNPNNPHNKRS